MEMTIAIIIISKKKQSLPSNQTCIDNYSQQFEYKSHSFTSSSYHLGEMKGGKSTHLFMYYVFDYLRSK